MEIYIAAGVGVVILLIVLLTFKKQPKEQKKFNPLVTFLETADDAYIYAHQIQDIKPFITYASSGVCNMVLDMIRSEEPKLFGTKTYRERKWTIISDTNGKVVVQKELTHKHVRIRKGVEVAIGEDLKERWVVSRDSNQFKVVEIIA